MMDITIDVLELRTVALKVLFLVENIVLHSRDIRLLAVFVLRIRKGWTLLR